MNTHFEDWIKQVEPHLFAEDEMPLLEKPQPFSWEHFSKNLQDHLELSQLAFHPQELGWRGKENLFEGIGSNPQLIYAIFAPLEGTVFWLISEQDLNALFNNILGEGRVNTELLSPSYKKGFYQYLALETMSHLEKSGLLAGLSPQLTTQEELPEEPYLCMDIGIQIKEKTLWGRLCLSKKFRRSWNHFRKKMELPIFSTLNPKVEVAISVEIGQTIFNVSELSALSLGDLILLETCSYDPDLKKGTVHLTYNGKHIFRGRLRNDQIKLNEYPIFFEELAPMDKDQTPNNKFESHDDDDDFADFDDDDDLFLEDEELASALAEELKQENAPKEEKEEGEEEVPAKEVSKKEIAEERTNISPSEIPLTLSVEIAHFKLTVKQLLELSPGNQLPLGKEPDNLVDLVVNGKCIGKGELIRVGDVLGVRILKL